MKYYDTSGHLLTNPNDIEKAKAGGTDYLYDFSAKVGAATIQGGRPYQEDRMLTELLDERYEGLTNRERKEVLRICFKTLNEQITSQECGSTGVVAIIDAARQNLIVANLGDSEVRQTEFDKEGAFKTPAKVIHSLHKPTTEKERKRIYLVGGSILKGRVNGMLAVSRGFGDKNHEPGLSHDPEINTYLFHPTKAEKTDGSQYMFIVASDGIDTAPLNEKLLEAILKFSGTDMLACDYAHKLCKTAKGYGSKDNITAQVAIVPAQAEEGAIPILLAVFDGHNGAEVSEYLRNHFMLHFNLALDKMIQQKKEANEKDQDMDVLSSKTATALVFNKPISSGDTVEPAAPTSPPLFEHVNVKP